MKAAMKAGDRVFKAAVWCGKLVVSEAKLQRVGLRWWLDDGRPAWGFRRRVEVGDGYASEADALLALGRELLDRAMRLEREVAETMALRADALEMASKARNEN